MITYSIPPFVSSLFFLLLGIFIFLKNKKNIVNITFFLVCFLTFWWQFSWFILFNTKDIFLANYLVKIGYASIILIPTIFFHFFLSFLKRKNTFDRILLYFSYLLVLIFEINLFTTNYFISGYYKYFFGFYPKAGILHPFYLFHLIIILFRIIYLSFLYLKQKGEYSSSYKYYQIKYVLLALIFYSLAASDFLVNYGIEFYPFGFVFIIFFLIIIGYAIIKHRLMDIRVVIRKGLIYSSLLGLIFILAYSSILILSRYFENLLKINFFLTSSLLSLILTLIFQPLKKAIQSFVDPLFFPWYRSRQELERDFKKFFRPEFNFQGFSQKTQELVNTIVITEKFDFLIFNELKGIYQSYLKNSNLVLKTNHPLVNFLVKEKQILLKEEISHLASSSTTRTIPLEELKNLELALEELKIEVVIPLCFEKKIIGLILLGKKQNLEAYTQEDLKNFDILKEELVYYLSSVMLYEKTLARVRKEYGEVEGEKVL